MSTVARKTIRDEVEIAGLGVRSGREITVRLLPAEADCGITLTRSDLDLTWPVDLDHTLPLPNCTSIGDDRGRVDFVEHLLALKQGTPHMSSQKLACLGERHAARLPLE